MAAGPKRGGGPKDAETSMSPTGYRCTDATRYELIAAGLFSDEVGMQAIIDVAVQEFLDRMRQTEGFSDAVKAAAASRARLRGNVRQLRGGDAG